MVNAAEDLGRQRFTLLSQAVDLQLKFREHGLAENRPPELPEIAVDEKRLFPPAFVRGRIAAGNQAPHQDVFVDGGGDFREKNGVILVDIGLSIRIQGVQAVAGLMGQGEHIPELPGKIEQHVRMHAVDIRCISPSCLARGFVDIHLAAGEQILQIHPIGAAERRQGIEHHGLGLFVSVGGFGHLHHRDIAVVNVQPVHPKQAAAHLQIPVINRQGGPHGLDQPGIDRPGQIVGKEGRIQAVLISPDPGSEHVGFHLPGIQSRDGVPHFLKRAVHRGKGIGPHPAVPALPHPGKQSVGQFDPAAILILHFAPVEIHAVQHGKRVIHGFEGRRRHGEELFFPRG